VEPGSNAYIPAGIRYDPVRRSTTLLVVLLLPAPLRGQADGGAFTADTARSRSVSLYEPYVEPYLPGVEALLLLPQPLPGNPALDLVPPLLLTGDMRWMDLRSVGRQEDLRASMMTPYVLERQREEELSTLKYVLGTVQVGGAMYLAYRYLKKNGLK
jgi:hypothetical protein